MSDWPYFSKFVNCLSGKRSYRWRSSTIAIVMTVALGLFVDALLYGTIIPCLPSILETRFRIPQDRVQKHISNLLATYAIASTIASPLAGLLSDSLPSRKLHFLASVLVLFGSTILFFLSPSPAFLYVARALQGIGAALGYTAGFSLCMEAVGTADLGKTAGVIFSTIEAGSLISPVLGGVVYTKTNSNGVLVFGCGMLFLDLVCRLLILGSPLQNTPAERDQRTPQEHGGGDNETKRAQAISEGFRLTHPLPRLCRSFPIVACLLGPCFPVTLLVNFAHATIVGGLEATLSLVAINFFGFDALKAGLLFIPLGVANCVAAALFGVLIDRIGTRSTAVCSQTYLGLVLCLLRLLHAGGSTQVVRLFVLLASIGSGLGLAGTPTTVEATIIVERYYHANQEILASQEPYGQMMALLDMAYYAGTAVGPELAGSFVSCCGFGNMGALLGGLGAFMAVLCFISYGRTTSWVRWRRSR